jgi:hypothetical protein
MLKHLDASFTALAADRVQGVALFSHTYWGCPGVY